MTNAEFIVFVTFILGTVPIAGYSIRSIRIFGVGLWLFSPIPVFYFSFVMSFVLRPLFNLYFEPMYGLAQFDYNAFVLAELLGASS